MGNFWFDLNKSYHYKLLLEAKGNLPNKPSLNGPL